MAINPELLQLPELPPLPELPGLPPLPIDPIFDVGRDQKFGLGAMTDVESSIRDFRQTFLGRVMQQRQLEALQEAGLPLDSDPNEWTLEDAQGQTDRAIARIASFNPALAQELQAQRTGEVETGKGFFNSLKSLAGDAIAGTGRFFEIITRPARIIPEILTDEDGDPVWVDAWQALTGQSTARYRDVLRNWGVMQNHPLVQAGIGLALDILGDPITYMTFGTAAAGRGAVQSITAKAVFGGKLADDVGAPVIRETAEKLLGQAAGNKTTQQLAADIMTFLKQPTAGMKFTDDGFVQGLTALGVHEAGLQQAVLRAWRAADEAVWAVQTVGIPRIGENMLGATGLTRAEVVKHLETWRRTMSQQAPTYLSARAAAGALGGVRFRVSFPGTQLRWIGPSLPGTERLGFSWVSRFFRGHSSIVRATQGALDGSHGFGVDDIFRWASSSMEEAIQANPALGQYLGGGWGGFGSGLLRVSDRIGQRTATWTPSTMAYRSGGVAGIIAAENRKRVLDSMAHLRRQIGGEWHGPAGTKVEGKVLKDKELFQYFEKHFAPHTAKGPFGVVRPDPVANLELWDNIATFLDGVPNRRLFEEGLDSVEIQLRTARLAGLTDDALEAEAGRIQAWRRSAEALTPDQREAAMRLADMVDVARQEVSRNGIIVKDATIGAEAAAMLRDVPEQVGRWQTGTAPEIAEKVFYLVKNDSDSIRNRLSNGVGPEDMLGGAQVGRERAGYGVHVTTTAPEEALRTGTAAKIRGGRWLVIDEAGPLSDVALFDEIFDEAHRLADGLRGKASTIDDFIDELKGLSGDNLFSDILQQRGYNGVIWKRPNGVMDATVLDPTNVKLIGDQAPLLLQDRGYWHRMFTSHIRRLVGRTTDPRVPQPRIAGVPQLEYNLTRTLNHLPIDEAEAVVRHSLRKQGFNITDDMPVFERNPIKVVEDYVNQSIDMVGQRQMGFALDQINAFGLAMPVASGRVVGRSVYRHDIPVNDAVLEILGDKYKKIAAKIANKRGKVSALEQKALDHVESSFAAIVEGVTGQARMGPNYTAPVARRIRGAARDIGRVATKERVRINDDIANLNRRIAQAKQAGETLHAQELRGALDNAIEYRRSLNEILKKGKGVDITADMKVRRLPDGTYELTAIHGTGNVAFQFKGGGLFAGTRRAASDHLRAVFGVAEGRKVFYEVNGRGLRALGTPENPIPESVVQKLARSGKAPDLTAEELASLGLEKLGARVRQQTFDGIKGKYDVIFYRSITEDPGNVAAVFLNPGKVKLRKLNTVSDDLVDKLRRELEQVELFGDRTRGALEKFAKDQSKIERQLHAAQQQAAGAIDEMNKFKAGMRTKLAEVKPAMVEDAADRVGFAPVKLRLPDGQTWQQWMPVPIAHEFSTLLNKVGGVRGLRQMWREWVLSRWKVWATIMSPGFHARNNYGAWFNNVIGGVSNADYGVTTRAARDALRPDRPSRALPKDVIDRYHLRNLLGADAENLTYLDLWRLMQEYGGGGSINSKGLVDAINLGDRWAQLGIRGVTRPRRGPVGAMFDTWQKGMGQTLAGVESFHRGAAWLAGMREGLGDIGSARAFTIMRHGDYLDLNDFEAGIKDMIPFYKWLRMNTPYQLHTLLEQPGIHASLFKMRDAAIAGFAGEDPEKFLAKLPQWMRDEFFFPWPKGLQGDEVQRIMLLDLPANELSKSFNEWLSVGFPILQEQIEAFGIKQVVFSGKKFTGKFIPLEKSPWLTPLRFVLQTAGIAKPSADGELMIRDDVAHSLRAFPMWSRFNNWITAEPHRVRQRTSSLFSFMLGAQFRQHTEEDLTAAELEFYNREVVPYLIEFKSRGVPLPGAEMVDDSVFRALDLPIRE